MVLGLTDRVVRSYRWVNEPDKFIKLEGKLLGRIHVENNCLIDVY